jgi:hypothetical protein
MGISSFMGGWPSLFTFFHSMNGHDWMIPLQYVNAEELVWLLAGGPAFEVELGGCPTLCGFSKGGGLVSVPIGKVREEGPKIPTLARAARMRHPQDQNHSNAGPPAQKSWVVVSFGKNLERP